MSTFKYMLGFVCCFVLVSLAQSQQTTSDEPAKQSQEPELIDLFGQDGPYFATGRNCPEGEVARPGLAPSCEPTCKNPRPICIKLYSGDYTPCFCQEPKVREEKTGKCVEVSECPQNDGQSNSKVTRH